MILANDNKMIVTKQMVNIYIVRTLYSEGNNIVFMTNYTKVLHVNARDF